MIYTVYLVKFQAGYLCRDMGDQDHEHHKTLAGAKKYIKSSLAICIYVFRLLISCVVHRTAYFLQQR